MTRRIFLGVCISFFFFLCFFFFFPSSLHRRTYFYKKETSFYQFGHLGLSTPQFIVFCFSLWYSWVMFWDVGNFFGKVRSFQDLFLQLVETRALFCLNYFHYWDKTLFSAVSLNALRIIRGWTLASGNEQSFPALCEELELFLLMLSGGLFWSLLFSSHVFVDQYPANTQGRHSVDPQSSPFVQLSSLFYSGLWTCAI